MKNGSATPTAFIGRVNTKTPKLSPAMVTVIHLGNNVYAVCIPIPKHRIQTPEISIEHLYSDEEIKTFDGSFRLYMGNEFNKNGYGLVDDA